MIRSDPCRAGGFTRAPPLPYLLPAASLCTDAAPTSTRLCYRALLSSRKSARSRPKGREGPVPGPWLSLFAGLCFFRNGDKNETRGEPGVLTLSPPHPEHPRLLAALRGAAGGRRGRRKQRRGCGENGDVGRAGLSAGGLAPEKHREKNDLLSHKLCCGRGAGSFRFSPKMSFGEAALAPVPWKGPRPGPRRA